MKNLFFVPFAFDEKKATGVNMTSDALQTYLKNLCVSLISAKKVSPDMDVALVCNISIPENYAKLLTDNGVLIFCESFDSFVFDDDYLWCLAFYKLCALEKMVSKHDYDHYIYTDADVFVQHPLERLLLECKDHIMLYDIGNGIGMRDYDTIVEEFRQFGIDSYITHYGGEFFGASRENAAKFVTQCKSVYEEMRQKNFVTTMGDEFILSIAAARLGTLVKNAGAYIFRFWTGSFYRVSTVYQNDEMLILHLPREKQHGMLNLYSKLVKRKKFPDNKKVHKICHLNHQPINCQVKNAVKKLLGR